MKPNINRPKVTNSRKALRQNRRLQKKINRNEHYTNKKTVKQISKIPGQYVKLATNSEGNGDLKKKRKKQNQPTFHEILQKERQKDKKETDALKAQMDEQRKKMLTQANEDEDKMIKKLEKQLGLSKSKNKTKLFTDDGLDYLLEICDRTTQEQVVAAEKHLANVDDESDFEEDLALITGKTKKSKKIKTKDNVEDTRDSDMSDDEEDDNKDDDNMSNSDESESQESGVELGNEDIEMMSGSDEDDNDYDNSLEMLDVTDSENEPSIDIKEKSKTKSNNTSKINTMTEEENDSELNDKEGDDDITESVKPNVWEDIYGRKRDKEGNVVKEEKGVYIPPHLRNKDSGSEKDLIQLKRQIKSVLNKLAGTNVHWACSTIENLYGTNSRHSVSSTLCSLWQDATVQVAATPDRLMAEHAALVAVLQANVGVEIGIICKNGMPLYIMEEEEIYKKGEEMKFCGAHFLEVLVKRFDAMMDVELAVENKELDNLISALAHLYSFKIYHANLLYDILNRLLTRLTEKNIECVLVALRVVGGVLRKEEPAALRTFIHDTQGKLTGVSLNASAGTRIKFLLDVLLAVKNNNLTKIPNYDPSYSEHLKKAIRGVIRKGNYVTALNIRLDDLLKSDERGKWWIVGSAWQGDNTKTTHDNKKTGPSHDQKLLELARQQRMNTDIRKSIFCVLMSAEDYIDAFDKLEHLGLKGPQQREIAHVMLVCLLNEKTYNPYYSVLARKLCEYDRKHRLSFQYTIWDKIKDLESLSKSSMEIFSRFIIHLIMETALPLSVLKVIEFSDLNKNTVRFMRQILLTIIVHPDTVSVNGIFEVVATTPKLKIFKDSLRLFIQHFVRRYTGQKTNKYTERELELLKKRTMEIDNILT